jgi:hypothetical protein
VRYLVIYMAVDPEILCADEYSFPGSVALNEQVWGFLETISLERRGHDSDVQEPSIMDWGAARAGPAVQCTRHEFSISTDLQ